MRTPRQGHLGVWTTALAGLLLCLPIADALAAFQPVRPILECVTQDGPSQYTAVYGYKNENLFPVIIPIGLHNKFTPSPQDRGQPTVFWPGRTPYDQGAFRVRFNGSNLVWTLKGPDGSTRTSTASAASKRCSGPTLTGLDPTTLSLTQGSSGTLTATISASQSGATAITLTSSAPAVAAVPTSVSVSPGTLSVPVPVTVGLSGSATITATLNGSSRQSTITVTPAGPTLTSLLPPTLQVTQGASASLTVTISALQGTDTVVPLSSTGAGIVSVPATVTIPAGAISVPVPVTALTPGTATLTAGPLNGTSVQSQVTVIVPPPTVASLAPPVLPLTEGSTGTLTVTLNASQPTDTEITLATSDPAIVSLPSGNTVTIPAGAVAVPVPVVGLSPGTATVTVALNGTTATSAITVQPPLPTVQAFTCPATLTTGVTGQCTVTINATQLTDTLVPLAASDPGIVTVPERVTVVAGAVAAAVPVAAVAPGSAVLTAGPLQGATATATVQVLPPPPALVGLTPTPATLFVGASTTLTLTLTAAQVTDTAVALASNPPGLLTIPTSVTVPARAVSVSVPVTALTVGSAVLTAGPLNGSTAEATVTVNQLPPTVAGITPSDLTLPKGTAESLTVTIAPVQSDPTAVPLTSSDPTIVEVPASVPVPAGSATAAFPVIGRNVGTAAVTAGPLNGMMAQATVTVTPPALVTLTIAPTAVTLAVGQKQAFTATGTYTDGTTQDLAATAAWTSSDEAIATVSNPGGGVTARAVGQATIMVTADGKSATATVAITPPTLTVLALTPTLPTRAVGQTLQFRVAGTYTDGATQDLTSTVTWTSSNVSVATITSPGGLATARVAGQSTITATHGGGLSASTTLTVTAPVVVGLAISPQSPTKTIGRTLQFTAAGTYSDGSTHTLTTAVTWTSSRPTVATITTTGGLATALAEGTTTITATHVSGPTASTTLTATILPPDPGAVAPAVNPSVATSLASATEFLYTGPDPVQTGVTPGAIEAQRAAVLRGKVLARDRSPLSGVTVSILDHPEYGTTLSRTDGLFDLAANGGGQLTVQYQKAGYLPIQRPVTPAWQDYAWLPDVVLIPYDTRVTTIDLTAANPIQVARGNPITDADGTRQATLFFPQGTTAAVQLPGGGTQPLTSLSIRATEYTVGSNGPQAMPGPLPSTSAYTYAVELSADEAVTQGVKRNGKDVLLNKPVVFFVENFLNFPVGGIVPVGYYDNTQAAWVPADNGRIIKLLAVTGGLATLDVTGSGTAADTATLAGLGITDAERQQLATLYTPGQSLWRVRLPHLSTWDANWGMGCLAVPGQVACQGPASPTRLAKDVSCATPYQGSIIGCQNQTLGEAVPLVGSPLQLHYASERTPGRRAASTVTIPLSGATLPVGVQQIVLEITIAGRQITQVYPALPNQTATFTWDGLDAYGRRPRGAQPITLRLGYTYPAVYQTPAQLTRSFGYNGGGFISGSRARETMTFWQVLSDTLGTWDARAQGLGGWTLGVHHAYDPLGRVLYEGTGQHRAAHDVGWVISTLAGTGTAGYGGDGGPAIQAQLSGPNAVAVDAQGNVFVVDQSNNRVRRISPDGLITTIAGTGVAGFSGDGGPATQAQLNFTSHGGGVAVDGQGAVYVTDRGNERIRKIGTDGVINTIAGTGVAGFSGDGGPIASAQFNAPFDLVVGRGGSLIITDWGNQRIRQVSPDGIVTTVAGTGVRGFSGDGGPATQAQLNSPTYTAVDAQGNLFIVDQNNHRIRKVSPGGVITTVAGTGTPGFSGDGGPATNAMLYYPATVVVDRDGSLFIVDEYNYRVRKVDPNGIITTVVGAGTPGFSGDGGPATAAATGILYHIALDGGGALVLGDYANQRVRRVAPSLPALTTGAISIASDDGRETYVFDATGRHLRTQDARTATVRYQFGYDANGYLTTVTDGDGNVTTIERDATGAPVGILSPFGQRTALTVDADGYLATLTNPAGETHRFTFGSDGLLQTLATPRNHEHRFAYDNLGRLTRDEDPAGGVSVLARAEMGVSYTTTLTTALNRASTYLVDPQADGSTRRVDTAPDGTQSELILGTDASRKTTAPDRTVSTLTQGPDPRFGMQAPIPKALSVRLPSGLTSSVTMTRAVTLGDPTNLLSLTSQTDTVTLNGRSATSTYSAAAQMITERSPANRLVTATLDTQGRVVREQVDGLEPVTFTYDSRGRLSTVTQGAGGAARTSAFAYNPEGFLEAITDPLSRTVRFTFDAAGRMLTQTFPDLRVIQTTYDANGNVASITPPSRPAHAFDYTPIDLEASYTPPDLGIGAVATTYTYNADRQLTHVTRPDGQVLTLDYEPTGGRLSAVTAPTGPTTYTYHPITGNLATITSPGGVGLSYTYDGSLLTGTSWTGPVAGSVTRAYDTDFRVATESVNGSNAIAFQYDPDSLLTQAGSLTLTRHAQHGLLTGTALGGVTDAYTYSTFGELDTYHASHNSSPLLNITYTRDALGRITQKGETIGGTTTITAYGYDTAGRLTDVTVDGALTAHYAYDGNGNRLSVTRPVSGTVAGTYDAQDRVTTYGAIAYTYTSNGDLLTATSGGETTAYAYDVFGNLTAVTVPSGTQIAYLIDGQNRRIGKKVNGVLTQGFLYGSQLRPAAELDGSGAVVARFVYGTRINVPDYMIKGGATYRLLTDHLGSVRLVVNSATATVAQRMDYDEFGQITADTAPGFQPFGFAGGLYDPDTKLVRFGARDYDAFTGRWTGKDPIGFGGKNTNLYEYTTASDPINLFDPTGLCDNSSNRKECHGKARILRGNVDHIGKQGGIPDAKVTADGVAVIPTQWGSRADTVQERNNWKKELRKSFSKVSGSFSGGAFSGIVDVVAGDSPIEGTPVRQALQILNPGILVIEIPGLSKDLGIMDVSLSIPINMECPTGTVAPLEQLR